MLVVWQCVPWPESLSHSPFRGVWQRAARRRLPALRRLTRQRQPLLSHLATLRPKMLAASSSRTGSSRDSSPMSSRCTSFSLPTRKVNRSSPSVTSATACCQTRLCGLSRFMPRAFNWKHREAVARPRPGSTTTSTTAPLPDTDYSVVMNAQSGRGTVVALTVESADAGPFHYQLSAR